MKKIILPVVLVASSLVFFSFKPLTKSVGVKGKAITTSPSKVQGCVEYNATNTTFTSCFRTFTPEVPTQPAPAPIEGTLERY